MNLKKIIYKKYQYGQIYFELRMLIDDKIEAHDDSAWRNNSFKFEEVNALNLEKTKLYYNQIRSGDLCDCCRNYIT